jgi:anti-sigma factor ChrR (cupin superfamily)
MTKICMALGVICLASAALADEPAAKPMAKKAKEPVMMTPADIKWADVPNMKGIQVAPLWGDAAKGAHWRFIKFAAGTDNPLHTHTNTLRTVILAGTFYTGADAASAKDLPAGSYGETPGGWKHVSGCRAGADCIILEESTGKFDFKPVEAAKAAAK